ncbi:MAG: antibiotic biosynthesis monooxygenase [Betaproteobacteria bacterium]|nr:antibiotic biosynthesis monooxygenase [Betaproteobacteria bacterium]
MFILLVELEAKPEAFGELETVLKSLVAIAAHESGIVHYSVQIPEGKANTFILYECYVDRAAWEAHLKFDPVKNELERFDTLLSAPPRITFCKMVASTPLNAVAPDCKK